MGEKQKARIEELETENATLRTQLENAKEAIRQIKRQIIMPPGDAFRRIIEDAAEAAYGGD